MCSAADVRGIIRDQHPLRQINCQAQCKSGLHVVDNASSGQWAWAPYIWPFHNHEYAACFCSLTRGSNAPDLRMARQTMTVKPTVQGEYNSAAPNTLFNRVEARRHAVLSSQMKLPVLVIPRVEAGEAGG